MNTTFHHKNARNVVEMDEQGGPAKKDKGKKKLTRTAKKKDGRKGVRKVRPLFNKILSHIPVFQCPICNKNLKGGESMSTHARSHKLDTPLHCPYSGCNSVSTFHNCVSLPGK